LYEQKHKIDIKKEELENIKKQLQDREQLFRTTIDGIDDMLYLLDPNLNVILYNDSFRRHAKLYGVKDSEFESDVVKILDYLDDKSRADYDRLKQDKKPIIIEEKLEFNERIIYTETRKIPILNDNGDLIYIVSIIRDISDKKRHEEYINELNKQLEERITERTAQLEEALEEKNLEVEERIKVENRLREANAQKDRFFSIIAHDLRNPLTAFVNYSELLEGHFDKLSSVEKHDLIKKMKLYSVNLVKMLENLLEWSKTQTGRKAVDKIRFNLYEIAGNCIRDLGVLAGNKEIKISNEIEPKLAVFADHSMIETVVRNLLSNAIKFSHRGGKILINAEAKGSFIKMTVCDCGTGIEESEIPKLFRIDQGRSHRGTENEAGSGLGLILCKEFVELNGGKISVESKIGEGSVFSFTIPAA
jgi:PAS domain S-box-containing protein